MLLNRFLVFSQRIYLSFKVFLLKPNVFNLVLQSVNFRLQSGLFLGKFRVVFGNQAVKCLLKNFTVTNTTFKTYVIAVRSVNETALHRFNQTIAHTLLKTHTESG